MSIFLMVILRETKMAEKKTLISSFKKEEFQIKENVEDRVWVLTPPAGQLCGWRKRQGLTMLLPVGKELMIWKQI